MNIGADGNGDREDWDLQTEDGKMRIRRLVEEKG
jgi:hypothetical protein